MLEVQIYRCVCICWAKIDMRSGQTALLMQVYTPTISASGCTAQTAAPIVDTHL